MSYMKNHLYEQRANPTTLSAESCYLINQQVGSCGKTVT